MDWQDGARCRKAEAVRELKLKCLNVVPSAGKNHPSSTPSDACPCLLWFCSVLLASFRRESHPCNGRVSTTENRYAEEGEDNDDTVHPHLFRARAHRAAPGFPVCGHTRLSPAAAAH